MLFFPVIGMSQNSAIFYNDHYFDTIKDQIEIERNDFIKTNGIKNVTIAIHRKTAHNSKGRQLSKRLEQYNNYGRIIYSKIIDTKEVSIRKYVYNKENLLEKTINETYSNTAVGLSQSKGEPPEFNTLYFHRKYDKQDRIIYEKEEGEFYKDFDKKVKRYPGFSTEWTYEYDAKNNKVKKYKIYRKPKKQKLLLETQYLRDNIIVHFFNDQEEPIYKEVYLTDTINKARIQKRMDTTGRISHKNIVYFNKHKQKIKTIHFDFEKNTEKQYDHDVTSGYGRNFYYYWYEKNRHMIKGVNSLEKYTHIYNNSGLVQKTEMDTVIIVYSYEFYD